MAEHSGNLEWNISGNSLTKFVNAKNGAEFASETFDVGQFTFQCKVYPNGRKKEQQGNVMLYFVLQTSLANKISKITVKARLYCPQTLCDWKHIQHLKKDNAGIGWHCRNMLLSEIQHQEQQKNPVSYIKFVCEITILRIEYKSNPQNIGINVYHKPVRMEQHCKHEWSINSKLLQSFQDSHNGKFYHSADYNHGCWCTSIAPNGASAKDLGNVKVGLQLLQLPASVSKIKCRFSISTNYEHIKCDGKKDFNYNSTFIAWSDGTFKTANLVNIQSQICFIVEIFVLKIYDEFNKEISRSHWSKYGIINNVDDEPEHNNPAGNVVGNPPNVMTKDLSHESANGGLNGGDYSYNLLSPCTQKRASGNASNTRMFSVSGNHNGESNNNRDSNSNSNANHSNENSSSGQFIVTNPEALTHSENGSNPNLVGKDKPMPLQIAKSSSSQCNSYSDAERLKSKTNHNSVGDALSGQSSYDLQHNLALLHSTNSKMNEIQCKMEEFDSNRCEDKQHLISIENSILNLTKSTNQAQQQQFDQNTILKQCITDLSSSMQRLTNEVVFMKNKVKKMESQISVQSGKISQIEEEKEKEKEQQFHHRHSLESATSAKHRRHSAKNTHFKKSKSRQSNKSKSKTKGNPNNANVDNLAPDLVAWIQHECGFPQYVSLFAENGYETLDIVKEMTKIELEEIGIVLKGHQFKIMKEIQKLDLYRKHVRNGGGDNKLDILHVANYLTPVQSPAASSDTTTTCTNVDDLRLIPVSPSLESNRSQHRNLKSMSHLHRNDSMVMQQRQYFHAHSRTQQFGSRQKNKQSMNMTMNMNMNMVKNEDKVMHESEEVEVDAQDQQTNGGKKNGLAVNQQTETGGNLTPMDEDADSSTDTNSPSYQSTAISDTSYATSATNNTAGYMQYQQHLPFHQQQMMTLKNGGANVLLSSPKHVGHLSAHFMHGNNNRAAAGYSPHGTPQKAYHMSAMSSIWQCTQCNNSNVNTFDKCEHCGFPAGYKL